MNDRKSNNDTLIITKSLKDVMFYEFIGDRYDVIARTAKLIFYRDLSKVFICQVHKIIIIYDFDLAELQVQTNLESTPTSFWFVSTRMTINGKIKVIDKDISDFSVDRTKRDWRD
jgi:hypothetical protein